MKPPAHQIIVVDDDKLFVKEVTSIVHRAGYPIKGFTSARDALDFVRDYHQPLVIILDWVMPEMDGKVFTEICKNTDLKRYAYILVVSSHADTSTQVSALESGCDAFIVKPLDYELTYRYIEKGFNQLNQSVRLDELQSAIDKIRLINPSVPFMNSEPADLLIQKRCRLLAPRATAYMFMLRLYPASNNATEALNLLANNEIAVQLAKCLDSLEIVSIAADDTIAIYDELDSVHELFANINHRILNKVNKLLPELKARVFVLQLNPNSPSSSAELVSAVNEYKRHDADPNSTISVIAH